MNKKEKDLYLVWRATQPKKPINMETTFLGPFLEWLEGRFYSCVHIGKLSPDGEYRATAFPDIVGEHEYDGIGKTRLEAVLDICIQIAKGES